MMGLNASTLRGQGSQSVGRAVLREFTSILGAENVVAWVPDSWRNDIQPAERIRYCRSGMTEKLKIDNIDIRKSIITNETTKLLSLTDTSTPSCTIPHMLLIHQAYIAYPRSAWPKTSNLFLAKMSLMEFYFSLGLRSVDLFTVQTRSMKENLITKWGLAEDRIKVIPSAIEIHAEQHHSWQDRPDTLDYICYIATPSPQKNMWILPDIMAELTRRGNAAKLHLTVSQNQVPNLVSRAKKLGVLDKFVFHGLLEKDKALDLLAGARATVMPTTLESFGLPFYEAMALGCPVVTADTDFAREALGESYRFARWPQVSQFADELEELLASKTLRDELSQRGLARYNTNKTTWKRVGRQYYDLLDGI